MRQQHILFGARRIALRPVRGCGKRNCRGLDKTRIVAVSPMRVSPVWQTRIDKNGNCKLSLTVNGHWQARVRSMKFLSLTSQHGNDCKWSGPSFMRCARVSPSLSFCCLSEESFSSLSPFTKLRPRATVPQRLNEDFCLFS